MKPPFPLILCCYLLASFFFFPYGTCQNVMLPRVIMLLVVSVILTYFNDVKGGNGPSKAGVKRSKSKSASSWGGQDSHPPPSSQVAEQKWNCESTTNDYAVTNSCSSSSTVVQNCESTTNDNVFTQSCSSSSSQSFTYYSNP
ncbi:hypothetical protein E1A91_A13G029100v1 [Gossypium mustelinum]|uniref:Uncharacterized protein n=1 Tax=Gossypium mustelinum TaxID=34275 RepID=A0A5D2WD69_GOSMU|nr:hypothetical protein E1A91_A13G029100v1 [Gossypium mustelinum]